MLENGEKPDAACSPVQQEVQVPLTYCHVVECVGGMNIETIICDFNCLLVKAAFQFENKNNYLCLFHSYTLVLVILKKDKLPLYLLYFK